MSKLVSVRINDMNLSSIEYIQNFFKKQTGTELPLSAIINLGLELYCERQLNQIADFQLERAGH